MSDDRAGRYIAWTPPPETKVDPQTERALSEFEDAFTRKVIEHRPEAYQPVSQPAVATPYWDRLLSSLHRLRMRFFPWRLTRIENK